MKPNGLTYAEAVDVRDNSRCHCACHVGRAPRLTDQVEAALCCDQCQLVHYEAEANVRVGNGPVAWRIR